MIITDDKHGRFANTWMYYVMAINLILLVDLVLHLFFYGPKAILKLKKEFILEALLQVSF